MSDQPRIKITFDDLEKVEPLGGAASSAPAAAASAAAGEAPASKYGNIAEVASKSAAAHDELPQRFYMQGWFYLGAAGLLGATLAWAICEPAFEDIEGGERWGNLMIFPLVVMLICFGFGIAESIVERSPKKAAQRGGLALLVGLVLGFVFNSVADVVYAIAVSFAFALGADSFENPGLWVARGIGWIFFGAAGGLVYGLVGASVKKGQYGVFGGVIGAGIGGMLFDPIALALDGAEVSRAVGFALFGAATGVAIGFVESALKDRWLHVSGGPLAGKQFILYKPVTTVGSLQTCDIYLFKDKAILPDHATVELRGGRTWLRAFGPVFVAGQPKQEAILNHGDVIQIGRYAFFFQEKQRQD